MSDDATTTADTATTNGDHGNGDAPPDDGASLRSEAARYRTRLRDAEQQRDALAQRLGRMQIAEVERLAAAAMHQPGDLWAVGVDLTTRLDDESNVDPQRVQDAGRHRAGHPSALAQEPRISGPGRTGHIAAGTVARRLGAPGGARHLGVACGTGERLWRFPGRPGAPVS